MSVELLSLVLQTPKSLPVLWWGRPGVGKTARIRELVQNHLHRHLETVIASVRDPTDFAGLPIPTDGGVSLAPPAWAKRLCALEKPGVLFLDEVSCAPPAVQAALLRVVHEGEVGDTSLPRGTAIVAAANPPDEAAGGYEQSAPLANRWVHVTGGEPAADEWISYMSGSGGGSGRLVRIEAEEWQREYGTALALTGAFLRRFPAKLHESAKAIQGRFPLAYATPRTWECAVRLVATARVAVGQGIQEDPTLRLVGGCIGDGIATEFSTFVREMDLPDPDEILADPAKWTPDKRRPDRDFAILCAVANAAVRPHKKSTERWNAAWQVMDRGIRGTGKDLVVHAAQTLVTRKPSNASITREVQVVVAQLKDVLRGSGLLGDGR